MINVNLNWKYRQKQVLKQWVDNLDTLEKENLFAHSLLEECGSAGRVGFEIPISEMSASTSKQDYFFSRK